MTRSALSWSRPRVDCSRRAFLGASLLATGCARRRPAAVPRAFELAEVDLATLSHGHGSARATCERYLGRIAELDGSLHAMLETDPDVLRIADGLDNERRMHGPRGPLHGVPVVLKDNIATADRMHTTAGSLALMDARPARDAFLVSRLRAAGAIVLGKTNLSEWANFRSPHAISGWSARGGQCRNPYALDRSPSGSSSGTAVAVSANLAMLGIGTETDGSILAPASTCGLVGIKPTVGRVSRTGVIPISRAQDTPGPMARTVADAATLLSVISAADPDDPDTVDSRSEDFTAAIATRDLRGVRIGVARQLFGFHAGSDRVATNALDVLRSLGATLIDPVAIPAHGQYDDAEGIVLRYEFKAALADYLARCASSPVRTLADVIRFNRDHADRELRFFGQETFERVDALGPADESAYRDALARCRSLARVAGLDTALARDRLDALVAPTAQPACMLDSVDGDHYLGSSTGPAAVAGYPSITVPAGDVRGLPVGISFFAGPYREARLIAIAAAFEAATHARRAPTLRASID